MAKASGGEPKKRGRPPGAKNKPRKIRRAAAPEGGKGQGRPKKEPPTPLVPIPPLALPPPSAFPAEIILPNGESFFEGEPTPSDDEVRAAAGGGGRGAKEPPPGFGAGGAADDGAPLMRGRRPCLHLTEETLQVIRALGLIRCTQPEAAARMGVSHKTFQRFLVENVIAREIWDDAQLCAKVSLRSLMFAHAIAGNAAVLLNMSKHWLGMTDKAADLPPGDEGGDEDKPEVVNQGGQVKRIVFELVDPKKPASAPKHVDPKN